MTSDPWCRSPSQRRPPREERRSASDAQRVGAVAVAAAGDAEHHLLDEIVDGRVTDGFIGGGVAEERRVGIALA